MGLPATDPIITYTIGMFPQPRGESFIFYAMKMADLFACKATEVSAVRFHRILLAVGLLLFLSVSWRARLRLKSVMRPPRCHRQHRQAFKHRLFFHRRKPRRNLYGGASFSNREWPEKKNRRDRRVLPRLLDLLCENPPAPVQRRGKLLSFSTLVQPGENFAVTMGPMRRSGGQRWQ